MLSSNPRTPSASKSRFGVCWWNTGLSPLSRLRATAGERSFAVELLQDIVKQLQVQIIALGEVHQYDLDEIKEALGQDFSISIGRVEANGLFFDTALIYRSNYFKLIRSLTLTVNYGITKLKLGEQVQLHCLLNDRSLNIVVSHWNSRIRHPNDCPARDEFGVEMRRLAGALQAAGDDHLIILGDLNDEPFSRPLAGSMLATQDRSMVLNHRGYLYNPFWRLLGESTHSKLGSAEFGPAGTYFQRGGNPTSWRVFDQMLFSQGFLKPSSFMIDEKSVRIFHNDALLEKLTGKRASIFDHLPIVAHIDLEN